MPTATPPRNVLRRVFSFLLIGVFVMVAAVLAVPVYSVHSTSDSIGSLQTTIASRSTAKTSQLNLLPNLSANVDFLPIPTDSPEVIATFAQDCTTPKTVFQLGDTVCAGVSFVTETDRFVNWLAPPDSSIAFSSPTIPDNQTHFYSYTPLVAGTWKATIADPTDSSIIPTEFTVVGPQTTAVATYAADCLTPKSVFTLGDTVCARQIGSDLADNRRFAWVDPAGLTRTFTPIVSDPQNDSIVLPTADTTVIDIFVVDNRGKWRVNVVAARGTTIFSAPFLVKGNTPIADLSLSKAINGVPPDAGTEFTYELTLTNFGPNAAADVSISDPTPLNATFVSVSQTSGPTFSCTGSDPVVCTRSSLGVGETASFVLTYTAGAADSSITNVASVTSSTVELNPFDNTASSGRVTVGGGSGTSATCNLECPNDITVASTSAAGATVTFASPEKFGDCGTLSTNPASGTVFPIGTTTVTASSTTGSGSCSFTVTVVDVPNPTISCPANQTAVATGGATQVNVSTGAPSASGDGVTVVGIRSDAEIDESGNPNISVSDPFPIGTTRVTWRATDQHDRSVSCVQTIVVSSPDAPTIACPSNKTFTGASGECNYTATAEEIGTPSTTGLDVTITSKRSDGLALTDPYPAGITFIEWTATNSTNIATCTQKITVATNSGDNTPPTFTFVPGPVTVTTNSCGQIVGESVLGTPEATDSDNNCSTGTVNISRSGVPAGNFFPTGTTTISYTATDAAGNSAIATQTVTVTESPAVPPTIAAPGPVTLFTGPGATSCGVTVADLDAALGTATASDNCPGVTVSRSNVPVGNVFPLGNTVITYTATDRSGNIDTDTQVVTVVDNTKPTISAPADVTLYTGPGATSCGVTVASLDASLGTATTSDNCPGAVTVARGGVPAGNVFPLGETFVTYTATDANTNSSAPVTQKVTVVDNTPPVVTPPANIVVQLPLNSTATSMVVNYPNPATATDNCPGAITFDYSPVSGSTFPVGPTTVTVTATDAHNNSATATFTVTVLYNFTGFFSPVSNSPVVNVVNAGRSIPLKFSLSGNKGLNIFAAGYPASQQTACDSSAVLSELEGTETPGGSTLTYSPDTYLYNWKTESSWAGTCRQLVVKLNDGSDHIALFKFK